MHPQRKSKKSGLKEFRKKIRIAVIGANRPKNENLLIAEELGRLIAKKGYILVCGGLGGIMEAAAKGADQEGGLIIGILPGNDLAAANQYVDLPIATGIGYLRNGMVVMNADLVIAIDGQYGTLSEIAFSQIFNKPLILINSWDVPGAYKAQSAREAIELVNQICSKKFERVDN